MTHERSAMALVFYRDMILVTHEVIYGSLKISLPKGHIEKDETIVNAAIRETFEESNVQLTISHHVKNLPSFKINFINHHNEEVEKIIHPVLFVVNKMGNPFSKEKQIVSVEYMRVSEFLKKSSYDNIKTLVNNAYEIIVGLNKD